MSQRAWSPRRVATLAGLLLLAAGCGGGGDGGTAPEQPGQLPFERYSNQYFSIDKPQGWEVKLAGDCTTFAFLARNPQNPLWQIFYFGTIGPVYLNQEQKDLDAWYVSQGGYPNTWMDAPVVNPLTPDNFIAHWPEIAAMQAATAFMPDFPRLQDLHVVATTPQSAMLPGATTANARGMFGLNGSPAEGMFLATVKVFLPYVPGNPGGGIGYGNLICGVTAPKGEFAANVGRLIESLNSFSVTQAYVDMCYVLQQQRWQTVAEQGRILSEASDIVWEGWQQRTHSQDISAEQWTDGYRGVERVYDPDTGEVYEFANGWYADYDLHRNEFDMSDLQPLPDDNWDLWMRAVLDGTSHFHSSAARRRRDRRPP